MTDVSSILLNKLVTSPEQCAQDRGSGHRIAGTRSIAHGRCSCLSCAKSLELLCQHPLTAAGVCKRDAGQPRQRTCLLETTSRWVNTQTFPA